MAAINDKINNANLDEEEDEDIDNQNQNVKNPELQFTDLRKTINQYLDQSNKLLERKINKEEEAWDMKFQNYWSNLIDFELELNKGIDDPEVINTKINVY